jgi:enoyl-CoA hydratase/carnithine racemase
VRRGRGSGRDGDVTLLFADMSVLVDDDNGVRVVTIDRPEKRNAIDRHVYAGLSEAFETAAARDDLGAVVLTGAGQEAFCAGADRDELASVAAGTGQEFAIAANRFCDALLVYPKPVVMAVNGMGVGMGTTLLGYADLAYAGESARFRTPFTAMGISPELGSSWLLPNLIGWQRAAWMLLSSEWVDAHTAAAWGLVLEVVPDRELLARATSAARSIAQHDLASVQAVKRTMLAWRTAAVERALDVEKQEFGPLLRRRPGSSSAAASP